MIALVIATTEELCLRGTLVPPRGGWLVWPGQRRKAPHGASHSHSWTEHRTGEGWMETFFAIPSTSLLPHREQKGMPITSDSEQTQGTLLNKPHDQLWHNPTAIACAWACVEIGSHASLWDLCLRGRTENAAHSFLKNQHLTKYPKMCFSARSYAAQGWTENSLLLWLPLALNLFTTPCWTAAKENKNIQNTCNCLVHILTFLFGGCFKLCSNIAGMFLQPLFPKRIHFTVLKLDTGCKNHTFEYFFQ